MSRLAELLYGLRHPGGQTRGFYNVRRAGWARRYGKDLDDDARDELLAAREDEEALTRHAKAGNEYAAALLAAVLYDGEDEHGLARHAKAGNSHAAARLAELLDDRGVRFPRFSGVFEDWFDLADQEGRLCCQHRGSTPRSCASARCGCIGSRVPGRRFGGWVSS